MNSSKRIFLSVSLFVLVACCFILLSNGVTVSGADSPPEGAVEFDAGGNKISISSVDVKNNEIKGVPLWRLQSPLEIEKTGNLVASVKGSLIHYGDGGWDEGAWSEKESKGYYLVIDFKGTTVSFKKIGDVQYDSGSYWMPRDGDTKLIYHMDEGSTNETIVLVTADDVKFSLNIGNTNIKKIPKVMKITKEDANNGKYDLKDLSTENIPTEDYCLIIESGVKSIVNTKKYVTSEPESNNSPLGDKLSYVVITSDCTKLGALAGGYSDKGEWGYKDGHTGEASDSNYCGVFTGCKSLTGLTILSKLETIQSRTFQGCSSLRSIELQGAIGTDYNRKSSEGPFHGCTGLESVSIVGNIWLMSEFINKKGNETVKAGNTGAMNVIRNGGGLKAGLFTDCDKLSTITVDANDVRIGDYLFCEYSKEDAGKQSTYVAVSSEKCSFIVNGDNCSIGDKTFWNTCINDIKGWNKIISIGEGAFSGTNFSNVEFGEGLIEIGAHAFSGSRGLSKINIPASVTTIGRDAFKGCNGVDSFSIDVNNPEYTYENGMILNKTQSKVTHVISPLLQDTVSIPTSVNEICDGVFEGTNLTQVSFNEGLVRIGVGAFNGCMHLSEVKIPASVTEIGTGAFAGCAENGTITFVGDKRLVNLGDDYIPASWGVIAPEFNRLYIESDHGMITATQTVGDQTSEFCSSSPLSEGFVTLTYNDRDSFEFLNWVITSKDSVDETRTQKTITISHEEITGSTTVSVKLRYYSQSNVLSNIFDFDSPTSSSDIHTLWQFRSSKTAGGSGMSTWMTTSVPLVVDDYVYAYTGDELYKLEGSTGEILAKTYVKELNDVYYRYLGYGGGYILDFNSDKVFDLDLNTVCSIDGDLKASFYDNGINYGLFYNNGLKLKQFTIDSSGVKYIEGFTVDVDEWYDNYYGTTSAPIIIGGHLYYISVSEKEISGSTVPYKIFLNSVNLSSGVKKKTDLELDYKYLDDGWLTTDGTYLYLTSYVGGLKTGENTGEQNSSEYNAKDSSVTRISIDGSGNMFKDFEVNLGYKGITSQFVVHNGRGYVNVNDPSSSGYVGFLLVYDMQSLSADCKPIYKTQSTYTHGSIVLDVKKINGDEKVYIYMVSYDLRSQGVVVIEDYAGKTESTNAIMLKTVDLVNYCSQGVRFLPNGSIVFYHDPGNIFCLGPAKLNEFFCFLNDGKNGKWISGTGSTVDEALKESGLIRIENSKTVLGATIDSSSNPTQGWDVYYLNKDGQWIKSAGGNIDGTQNDLKGRHYWQIVKTGSSYTEPGSLWTYEGGEYVFSPLIGSKDVLDKTLTYGGAAIQHAISLPTGVKATVSSSVQSALEGEVVDITVKPESGFYVYSVSYQTSESQAVVIGTIGSDVYRFSMPGADVSIVVDVKPLLTVTYHIGNGAGRDVDVYIESGIPVYNFTVYDGYKLTLRYRNSENSVSECPSWLKKVSDWEYSGVVSGGDSAFKSSVYGGGNAGMSDSQITLRVNTYDDLQKEGTIHLNSIPEGVTNAGREFLGWSTSSDGRSAEFTAGQEYNLVSDVDLYAVWSEQPAYHTITLDLAGGVSESVSAEAGWIYDNDSKVWSKQFVSGALFPTISDPIKAADSTNSYAFSSWSETFPEKVTESKTYTANYREAAASSSTKYDVACAAQIDSGSMRTYTLNIDRSSGSTDIEESRLLVIANYGGQYVNVYSKIDLNNGHAVEKVRLSIIGLTGLTFDIVSGFPEGTYENHGTLTPDLT